MNSDTNARLVNASILLEVATDFGTTYLQRVSGAWGRPADALAAAVKRAENTAAAVFHGYRVAGIAITDVKTGEQWAVTI